VIRSKDSSAEHIINSTRGSNNDMDSRLKFGDVISDSGTSNAGVASNVQIVSKCKDDLLNLLSQFSGWSQNQSLAFVNGEIEGVENSNGESGSFTSSRLGLCDDIEAFAKRHNGSLLDSRRLFKTISINSSEEIFSKIHVIEVVINLIIVTLKFEIINGSFVGCGFWLLGHDILFFEGSLNYLTLRVLKKGRWLFRYR